MLKIAKNEAAKSAEILVYGIIGGGLFEDGITGKQFVDALNTLGSDVGEIHVRINSVGGSAFDGQAIYNALIAHPAKKTVSVEGVAASAASFVAMAGDTIRMYANSLMMIHRSWNLTMGNVSDHQKSIELLSRLDGVVADVYAKRAGKDVAVFADLMEKESWFTADEAQAQGLATEIIPNKGNEPAACVGPDCPVVKSFKHVPEAAKAFFTLKPKVPIGTLAALNRLKEIDAEASADVARIIAALNEGITQTAAPGSKETPMSTPTPKACGCGAKAEEQTPAKTETTPEPKNTTFWCECDSCGWQEQGMSSKPGKCPECGEYDVVCEPEDVDDRADEAAKVAARAYRIERRAVRQRLREIKENAAAVA